MSLKKVQICLQDARGKKISREERAQKTLELTQLLIEAAHHETTREEKRRERWLSRMVQDPNGRAFMTSMTDQVFRSHSTQRTADQLHYLIKKFGIPKFFSSSDRMKFHIFQSLGPTFHTWIMPIIRKQIKEEMAHVLLPENPVDQIAYFQQCRKENTRINLNHLGEAILGEKEACRRLKTYLEDLANPQIEYVSVKISTIYSQINLIAFSQTLETLSDRLRLLYTVAQKNFFTRTDGSQVPKFVNLDMEEYKDLDLTVAVFKKVLSEEEFLGLQAGIVLQSYLPNAYGIQQSLTEWARERVQQGGAPIKIRLVKGANLAMERVESSLYNWELATFSQKIESDANFKRMLEYGATKGNAEVAHIGVGSHNLFDIAYALLLRAENETENFVSFEMLQGMAEPMQRLIKKLTGSILLYCPEAKEKDFHTAVAYLIRRLDENSGSDNFLRHFFEIHPNNHVWKEQASLFLKGCDLIEGLATKPRRTLQRQKTPDIFANEPDSDFSLEQNRIWIDKIYSEWKQKKHHHIPLIIGGEEITTIPANGYDPTNLKIPLYQYSLADVPLIEKAIETAAVAKWVERSTALSNAAHIFRRKRGDLIGAMIADGGKTAWEADPEVSEAIDFIEYYSKTWENQLKINDLKWSAKGVVLVAPPWNFPCSISVSGIAAALVAGNSVLFKPPPEAVLVGWYVANAFWEAGVPKDVLQFINCKEDTVGNYLIKHPKVSSIILTGGTQTARHFLKLRPGMDLHAETGGKNALIVTAMSDRDLAVRDIVASAFGHSGQKCSACSLAILEAEVYDDPQFKNQLADAVASLRVGSAWDKNSKIIPLIRPPEKALYYALTQLEEGESWLLEPKQDPHLSNLWSPGIKLGVREGSFMHQTELFGPILGVMRAENLQEAIRLANGTPYGLTSGLHSLDEREQIYWHRAIIAGNLYINRQITGAIVQRQPFGGCKDSSFGSGAKAGGPNYVHQFATPHQIGMPQEKSALPPSILSIINAFKLDEKQKEVWKKSAESYAYWAPLLKTPVDPSAVIGQDNLFYHVSLDKVYIRISNQDDTLPLLQAITACLICQTPLEVSSSFPIPTLSNIIPTTIEDEATLLKKNAHHIRTLAPSPSLKEAAALQGIILKDQPILMNGRFELLHYLREVSLSVNTHRYGYLGK